jgi:AcrR family transcriptional regulator
LERETLAPKLKPETLEERKTQILQAALTCFARKGYHHATMDDIVEEAGLSKGGVYWHFGSKKELFLALFESMAADMDVAVQAAAREQTSARQRLEMLLEVFTRLTAESEFREMMPLLIDVWAQNWRDSDVNEAAMLVYRHFRDPLATVIDEGVAAGEFKPVDGPTLAGILIAIYDGLMVQWMIDETVVDWDMISDTLTRTLLAGLLQ